MAIDDVVEGEIQIFVFSCDCYTNEDWKYSWVKSYARKQQSYFLKKSKAKSKYESSIKKLKKEGYKRLKDSKPLTARLEYQRVPYSSSAPYKVCDCADLAIKAVKMKLADLLKDSQGKLFLKGEPIND